MRVVCGSSTAAKQEATESPVVSYRLQTVKEYANILESDMELSFLLGLERWLSCSPSKRT